MAFGIEPWRRFADRFYSDSAVGLAGSLPLVEGYGDAMSIEADGSGRTYVQAAIAVADLVVMVGGAGHGLSAFRRAALCTCTLACLWPVLKHGFIRHDGHEVIFFAVPLAMVAAEMVVLAKPVNRCGAPRMVRSQRVVAGESIRLPATSPNEVLVARFTSTGRTMADRVGAFFLKPVQSLYGSLDGVAYRLPRGLSQGPLILRLPAREQAMGGLDGYPDASLLGFSESEVLTLEPMTLGAD